MLELKPLKYKKQNIHILLNIYEPINWVENQP